MRNTNYLKFCEVRISGKRCRLKIGEHPRCEMCTRLFHGTPCDCSKDFYLPLIKEECFICHNKCDKGRTKEGSMDALWKRYLVRGNLCGSCNDDSIRSSGIGFKSDEEKKEYVKLQRQKRLSRQREYYRETHGLKEE